MEENAMTEAMAAMEKNNQLWVGARGLLWLDDDRIDIICNNQY